MPFGKTLPEEVGELVLEFGALLFPLDLGFFAVEVEELELELDGLELAVEEFIED